MRVRIAEGLEGARQATGDVVILDVLRAFTTAAYAFAAGIQEIELVGTVEEALTRPGFRMGEVGGRLIPGFDHDNSPSRLLGRRLSGRAVQRTGAGTQCAVAATKASRLWLGSLVVASATARALSSSEEVTLVLSGCPQEGEEDRAAARVLEAILQAQPVPRQEAIEGVRTSRAARLHQAGDPDRPLEDLDCATAIDRFDFAMKVERNEGRFVARAQRFPKTLA